MAVINFAFAGLGLIGVISMSVMFTFKDKLIKMVEEGGDKEGADGLRVLFESGTGFLVAMIALNVLSSLLLVFSAVGYLKQKKVMGRGLGNIYALLTIVVSLVSMIMLPEKAGGGVTSPLSLLNFIYPLVTLYLLNLTFKEDFIR